MTLKYFTILGERNSGTHFVEYAFKFNFEMHYERNEKHFFGFGELDNIPRLDETLVICVVRNPIDWIDSFFKRLHHIPRENKKNIVSFITNEFYSIYEEGDKINTEIMNDRNILNGERYKNIFELRKVKNDYLMNEIPKKAKHSLLLRYEDLRDHYDETMQMIQEEFNLTRISGKTEPVYNKVPRYKGTYTASYEKKPLLLNDEIQKYIKQNVDIEQERVLEYLP